MRWPDVRSIMKTTFRSLHFYAVATGLLLAGCNTSGPNPSAGGNPPPSAPAAATYRNVPAGVTPSSFRMPTGGGCQGDIARWNAIQNNDLRSGHVSKSVFDKIQGEIAEARAACNAGQSAKASALVRASRARHGYPGG